MGTLAKYSWEKYRTKLLKGHCKVICWSFKAFGVRTYYYLAQPQGTALKPAAVNNFILINCLVPFFPLKSEASYSTTWCTSLLTAVNLPLSLCVRFVLLFIEATNMLPRIPVFAQNGHAVSFRIHCWNPLAGGSTDKKTGETPHGHCHRCSLCEIGEGQHHPVTDHWGLPSAVQCLEYLQKYFTQEWRHGKEFRFSYKDSLQLQDSEVHKLNSQIQLWV